MASTYHILNGDALLAQFPAPLEGERIVLRECLVDGPVGGTTLEEFYAHRIAFLGQQHAETKEGYQEKAIGEFTKIRQMEAGATVCLWFEEDLFCQVNFWFACWLIDASEACYEVFLVSPPAFTPYSFGRLSTEELKDCYRVKIPLPDLSPFAQLWKAYQLEDMETLLRIAEAQATHYPFLLPAVQAHIARKPSSGTLGRPKETLRAIVKEVGSDDFGRVFREFQQREGIYGFGDVQVKRLFDELLA